MRRRFAPALLLWLTFVTLCVALIAQTRFTADLSAFLPRSPTPEQQLLVDQLRDGMVSRLILVGIEGGDAQERARVSLALGGALRADPAFGVVANGEAVHHERDQALLFEYRYLLSPTVSPERFTTHGLRGALGESLDLLASPIGMLAAPLLARDPTGEMFQLIERFDSAGAPRLHGGAWTSRDGRHALLLVQTRAAGSDLDGQQDAILRIRAAFAAALEKTEPSEPGLALLLTGPGVFAVESRATIQREVLRLALVATTLIVTLLLFIYRSPTALLLGLLPVVSGALAGIAAVSLGFGMVHGVTLGFGTTLIGEAVDYAIYRLVQAAPDAQAPAGEQVFWPTVRLGVLTSICGFAALLLSGFPGLAQLGLYSIIGLVVAAGTTRFVLPHLLPADFRVRDVSPLGERLRGAVGAATRLRWLLAALTLFAVVFLVTERDRIWNHELAALSPVPAADQALDEALRTDLGAPDVRYVVVMPGADRDAALEAAERAGERLQSLVEEGVIAGFESPARYLPSRSTQSARRASLPEPDTLAPRLAAATADLPLRPDRLSPFVADVAAARRQPLLTRESLAGTSFALAVDSLLVAQHGRWSALLPCARLLAPGRWTPAGSGPPSKARAARQAPCSST